MACFYPMQALRLESKTKSGKSVVKFIRKVFGFKDSRLLEGLPCGQ